MLKKFRKNLLQLVLIIFFLYFFVIVFLYFYQRNLLYHPNENNYSGDEISVDIKEVKIQTSDNIELLGWYHEKDLKNYKTLIIAIGRINSSRLFISRRIILLALFGPKPGSFDINFINSSISLIFCINYNGHLKPGIPKPPVAFEISSVVFDLR